jgi:hypothetical protein
MGQASEFMTDRSQQGGFMKLAAILLAALVLQGCSDPKLSFVPEGSTILAFGDSLTLP